MATQMGFGEAFTPTGRKPLEALQHIRRMRGGAQSHLLRASDNQYYVTKFADNPQHVRVLANEYLGSRIGQLLGLPMPTVEIIEVSESLIQNSPELRLELSGTSYPFTGGLHVASHFGADVENTHVLDYLPEASWAKVLNRCDFARTLVFDKWTGNADARQAVFIRLRRSAGYMARFVDQGYCFNAGEWNFSVQPLHGVFYQNHVYQEVRSWDSFEPALSAAEEMHISDIWDCAAGIPTEWCSPEPDELCCLVEELHRRREKIRDLITAFRESCRSPFPNWTV